MPESRTETFIDFFKRPIQQYETNPYTNDIRAEADLAAGTETVKFQTLFTDCFGHHIQFNLNAAPEIKVVPNATRRIVEADGLTSYFLEKLYTPPALFESNNQPPPPESRRTFQYLFDRVTENPVTDNGGTRAAQGSNLVTFVIAEVGTGKTLLLCKLVRDIVNKQKHLVTSKMDSETLYNPWVVPVYFDFESKMKNDGRLHDIDEHFYRTVFDLVMTTIAQTAYVDSLIDGSEVEKLSKSPGNQAFVSLVQYLHSASIRLVLFFDNMDGYHYYFSKHAFFQEYYEQQRESIQRNITLLINTFTHGDSFGMLGLSVVFATRKTVYRDCARFTEPEFCSGFPGVVFQVEKTSSEMVTRTRLNLFTEAVVKIEQHERTRDTGREFRKTLERIRLVLGLQAAADEFSSQSPSSEAASMIGRIGHQGNRSLVQFLSNLKLDYRNDGELFERFFTNKPHSLILLYMVNLRERYTQGAGHFPNLFLVDAMVAHDPEFPLAHCPHIHTYWLKFVILRLVLKSPDKIMNTNLLRGYLRGENGYDVRLINLALGSLSTSRHSWCLEPDGMTTKLAPTLVKMTDRGRYLMEVPQGGKTPFCFSFTYLQLIVDDNLMSYPDLLFSEIYIPDANLKYLCEPQPRYSTGLRYYLSRKMRAVLAFILLLEVSWTRERKHRQDLFEKLERTYGTVAPDFDVIRSELLGEYRKILRTVEPSEKELSDLRQYEAKLARESKPRLERFFDRYYESGVKVEE